MENMYSTPYKGDTTAIDNGSQGQAVVGESHQDEQPSEPLYHELDTTEVDMEEEEEEDQLYSTIS